MKLSDVIAALSKAQNIIGEGVGDAEVVLKDIEDGSGSVLHRIEFAIAEESGIVASQLTLVHGPADPAIAAVKLDPPTGTVSTDTPAESLDTSATSA